MTEIKKAKPVSWSEAWLYWNKPDSWYSQYILGIKEPATREMELGNIIHLALEGADWKTEFKKHNFTSDYERTIEEILKYQFPAIPEKEKWLGDYGKIYSQIECGLAARVDGIDTKNHIIYENKTSKSFWTQEKADTHGQLTLYSFIYREKYGVIPSLILFSINVGNGKIKMIETKRSEYQINEFITQIRQMVADLKSRNLWNARVSNYKK